MGRYLVLSVSAFVAFVAGCSSNAGDASPTSSTSADSGAAQTADGGSSDATGPGQTGNDARAADASHADGGGGGGGNGDGGGAPEGGEGGTATDGGCTPSANLARDGGVPLGCAAKPSACCYPDDTNTGVPAGTTLTPKAGGFEVNTDGTVLSGLDITGSVDIYASNVTIKNSRITVSSSGSFAVAIRSGSTGTTIRDTVIRGQDNDTNSVEYAIANLGGTKIVVQRVDLSNCSECVMGGDITLTDSFIHDAADPPGAHVESIYGLANTVYAHNTMFNSYSQTAAVYMDPNLGGTLDCNCTISDNLLAGGGYTIYGGGSGPTTATNVVIKNNRFARTYYPNSGYYGVDAYFDPKGAGNAWTGNFWDDTAAQVSQ